MASTKTGSRGYNPLDPPASDIPVVAPDIDDTNEELSVEDEGAPQPEPRTPIRGVPPPPESPSRSSLYSRPEQFNINKAAKSDLMPVDLRNARALGMDGEQIKALMTTKEHLDSLPKVPVYLRPAEKGEPNFREVTINGYKATVQRGRLVEVNIAVYERLIVAGEVDPRTDEDLLLVPVLDGRLIAATQVDENGILGSRIN